MLRFEHERESHHGSRALIVETTDRRGRPQIIRAQGFKHTGVYERISPDTHRTIWLERGLDRTIVWEAKPRHTLEQVRELRDHAFPDCTLCVWEGGDDGHFVLIDRPRGASVGHIAHAPLPQPRTCASKGKAKRKHHKIRRSA